MGQLNQKIIEGLGPSKKWGQTLLAYASQGGTAPGLQQERTAEGYVKPHALFDLEKGTVEKF